jgi:hypothetical protein
MVARVPVADRGLPPEKEIPVRALEISSGFCVLKYRHEMRKACARWPEPSQDADTIKAAIGSPGRAAAKPDKLQ